MVDGGVPGIEDASRLGRWLTDNGVPGDQDRPPRATLIAGGRSNLTYLLDCGPSPDPPTRRCWCCAARRSAMFCRPPTTWPGNTGCSVP